LQACATQLSHYRESVAFKEEAVRLSGPEERMDRLETLVGRVAESLSAAETVTVRVDDDVRILKEAVAALQAELKKLKDSPEPLQEELRALKERTQKYYSSVFVCVIVSNFPEIFAEFRGKCFLLLWRDSSDVFRACDFHGRCDGHANTLTMILETKLTIFSGFAPVDNNCGLSLKSPLFTLTVEKTRQFVVLRNEVQTALKFVLINAMQTPD
jgi:hypothetical protein